MSVERDELVNYCLRKLGAPIVKVNLTPDQMQDCIDDTLQEYTKKHYNGTERKWIKKTITAQDITNQYVTLPNLVVSVVKVLPITTTGSDVQFSNLWQYRADAVAPIAFGGDGSMVHYELAMQNLNLIDDIFANRPPVAFTSNQDRLYLTMDWNKFTADESNIVIECHVAIDPEEFPKIYSESWVKKYAVALMKKQWGSNLKKFQGVQLPGGITLDGKVIFDEAMEELAKLEEDLSGNELPLDFMVG